VHLDHQDVTWLAGVLSEKETITTTTRDVTHPSTGQKLRRSHSWTYRPSTQTATVTLQWEALGADGDIVERWELGPMALHCVFRFEMEHLLERVGFSIQAVYGDFFRHELADDSKEMLWLARNAAA
jgi:hypothetical protein